MTALPRRELLKAKKVAVPMFTFIAGLQPKKRLLDAEQRLCPACKEEKCGFLTGGGAGQGRAVARAANGSDCGRGPSKISSIARAAEDVSERRAGGER